MKSIRQLIQHLNVSNDTFRKREFDAFLQLDENTIELSNRIKALELKNMRYFCRAHSTVPQTIPSAVITPLNLASTFYPQFGNMHDNVNNPSLVTIRRNGVYHVIGSLIFELHAALYDAILNITLVRSGAVYYIAWDAKAVTANHYEALNASTLLYAYEDDVILLEAYQNTGGPLNTVSDAVPYLRSVSLSVSERMEDLDPSQYGLLDPNANMR